MNSLSYVQKYWQVIALLLLLILFTPQLFGVDITRTPRSNSANSISDLELAKKVTPAQGIILPLEWNDLGKQMVAKGVIDAEKFESLYQRRGGIDTEAQQLLYGTNTGRLKMTAENAGTLLNLFWAFGLSNQNLVLEEGPMRDPRYGGAGRFASTGGWTLAQGDAMDHYGKHPFVQLTKEQQVSVERVAQNIYRPCCNNATYFPDCNHGMAMLGLLELMAAQGTKEQEMYDIALQVNSYWFPSTYLTIAKYFQARGVEWADVSAETVLGSSYSSASGFRQILAEVEPVQSGGGGSCGV